MADTAAHLVDRVLPEAPVRQWVLSLPFSLRYRLAYDARLTSDVLRILLVVTHPSSAGPWSSISRHVGPGSRERE